MTEFDCQTCGACCVTEHPSAGYIPLTTTDLARFTTAMKRRLVIVQNTEHQLRTRAAAPGTHYLCALHAGSVGVRSSCAAYSRRPDVCREFLPGSSACLEAREYVTQFRARYANR